MSLYVRSCESSSSWRAAASSDAIEDLPTPEGPQRRISCPAAAPLPGADASAMGLPRQRLEENRGQPGRNFGISLKRPAKLTPKNEYSTGASTQATKWPCCGSSAS